MAILNVVLLKIASIAHKWKHWSVVVHERNGCVHNTGSVLGLSWPACSLPLTLSAPNSCACPIVNTDSCTTAEVSCQHLK